MAAVKRSGKYIHKGCWLPTIYWYSLHIEDGNESRIGKLIKTIAKDLHLISIFQIQQQTMMALFYEASMCQRENVISSPFSFSLTLKERKKEKIIERQGDANMCFILFFFLNFFNIDILAKLELRTWILERDHFLSQNYTLTLTLRNRKNLKLICTFVVPI